MKTVEMEITVPDWGGAVKWILISMVGFHLRYPEASTAGSGAPPGPLKATLHRFTKYGDELAVTECDLADCIQEFRMACDHYYADPGLLGLKKFAVVYHVDNFCIRVHKVIENVYEMFAQIVGLDPERRPKKRRVKDRLQEQGLQPIVGALQDLEENKWIQRAVNDRNLFVHRYRDPEWPMLGAEARFREPDESEDPLASEVRRIDQASDLDRYAALKIDELSQTLGPIRAFRDQILEMFDDKLKERIRTP